MPFFLALPRLPALALPDLPAPPLPPLLRRDARRWARGARRWGPPTLAAWATYAALVAAFGRLGAPAQGWHATAENWVRGASEPTVVFLLAVVVPLLMGAYQLTPALGGPEFEALLLARLSRRELVADVWLGYWLRTMGWLLVVRAIWMGIWLPMLSPGEALRAATTLAWWLPVEAALEALFTSHLLGAVLRRRGRRDILLVESLLALCLLYPIVLGLLLFVFLALFVMTIVPVLFVGLFIIEVAAGGIGPLREGILLLTGCFAVIYVVFWGRTIVRANLDAAEIVCVPADWVTAG